eukprot:jgi/Mesvir1/7207/Mv19029-RA.1
MHKYRLVAKKGEGTFSEVLKAQCIKNGKYVAIKCMKNHFDSLEQVNNLREIQALRRLSPHPNIIKLLEVLYDQPTGRLALVFELMDMNIYELIRGRRHYVAEEKTKNLMYQLMKSMDHMHRNGIFHRDIKPENVLLIDDSLKLADFGSCRGIYSKQPYTEYISTRWYRAPECLLTDGYYNYKMDMWGVGCVFFEIVSLFPLFPGTNEIDQITKIHNILGTPPPELLAKMKKSQHMDFNFPPKEGTGIEKLIPHCSRDCIELITKLLAYNPDERLSARQALRCSYFKELRDAEKRAARLAAAANGGSPTAGQGAENAGNMSNRSEHSANPAQSVEGSTLPGKHKGKESTLGGTSSDTLPSIMASTTFPPMRDEPPSGDEASDLEAPEKDDHRHHGKATLGGGTGGLGGDTLTRLGGGGQGAVDPLSNGHALPSLRHGEDSSQGEMDDSDGGSSPALPPIGGGLPKVSMGGGSGMSTLGGTKGKLYGSSKHKKGIASKSMGGSTLGIASGIHRQNSFQKGNPAKGLPSSSLQPPGPPMGMGAAAVDPNASKKGKDGGSTKFYASPYSQRNAGGKDRF